jgi:N-carbamoylputrescine amidase
VVWHIFCFVCFDASTHIYSMTPQQKTTTAAPVRVACCQIEPVIGEKKANLAKTAEFIERAALQGANIIVLPELCSSGYVFESRAEAISLSDAYLDGESTNLWADLAQDLNVYIVAGFTERSENTLYNSAAVLGPKGRIGLYRKVHLWGDENLFFSPGDLGFPVFATEHGTIGVLICYDGWFPESYRRCALQGAELVCVPTNWVPIPGQDMKREAMANILTMASSHTNSIYIAAADRIGTERGQSFIGQSLITSHTGWPIGEPASASEEQIIFADLDLVQAKRARRWNDFNQVLRDRRPEAYI